MGKHSPSPWRVNDNGNIVDARGWVVFLGTYGHGRPDGTDGRKVDLYLAAAAPELLEVCKRFAHALKEETDREFTNKLQDALCALYEVEKKIEKHQK